MGQRLLGTVTNTPRPPALWLSERLRGPNAAYWRSFTRAAAIRLSAPPCVSRNCRCDKERIRSPPLPRGDRARLRISSYSAIARAKPPILRLSENPELRRRLPGAWAFPAAAMHIVPCQILNLPKPTRHTVSICNPPSADVSPPAARGQPGMPPLRSCQLRRFPPITCQLRFRQPPLRSCHLRTRAAWGAAWSAVASPRSPHWRRSRAPKDQAEAPRAAWLKVKG